MNELPKVPVGLATKVGYALTVLGIVASTISAIEQSFPTAGKWCVVATAVIAAITTIGRQLQAAALGHASIIATAGEILPEVPGLLRGVEASDPSKLPPDGTDGPHVPRSA